MNNWKNIAIFYKVNNYFLIKEQYEYAIIAKCQQPSDIEYKRSQNIPLIFFGSGIVDLGVS